MLKDDLEPTYTFRENKKYAEQTYQNIFHIIKLFSSFRCKQSIWNRNKHNLFNHEIETNWTDYTTQIKFQSTSYSACILMKIYI